MEHKKAREDQRPAAPGSPVEPDEDEASEIPEGYVPA
jgi:hypothetical protein